MRQPRAAADGEQCWGPHSRSFKDVFNAAQHELQDTFGMELAELPSREKVTLRQKRGEQSAMQSRAR